MSLFPSNLFYHLETHPRRFPAGQEVQSIGYIREKKGRVRRNFDTINFSFILSGQGEYEWNGRMHRIEAPMVLTQLPGQWVNYAPKPAWEELFLIFPADCAPLLKKRGFVKAFWEIHSAEEIKMGIQDLIHDLEHLKGDTAPDSIDWQLQKLIMTSLKEQHHGAESELQTFISGICQSIELDCSQNLDFNKEADKQSFSPSTARRAWEKRYGIPPGQYLLELRMQKACRRLAETEDSIKEIALSLGFTDPLYFTKLFKKKRAESPTAYRKRTREPFINASTP